MPEAYETYRRDREAREITGAMAAEANRAENEAARRRYLADVEASRAAKIEEARQAEYAALEADGTKERTRRGWLASDVSRTPADFERAWLHLRDNLIQDRRREEAEGLQDRLRARYPL